jgi:archaemetzincin
MPRPLDAFDHDRTQYHARQLLDRVVDAVDHADDEAVLAVLDNDIYIEPYTFTFGHCGLRSGVGVLSVTRVRPAFYGESLGNEAFHRRVLVEALYQVGRILGLSSCELPECTMAASDGVGDVDRKSDEFCGACRGSLGALLLTG